MPEYPKDVRQGAVHAEAYLYTGSTISRGSFGVVVRLWEQL